ncbi:MAG: NAD(P)H-dependent oxidoreductase [Ornithinimicrobium sp.]
MTHTPILVGSLRDGDNEALATAATTCLSQQGHAVPRYTDLASIPHDTEEIVDSGVDAQIDAFRDALTESDAVLFVPPEHHGRPSNLVEHALDVSSRPHGPGSDPRGHLQGALPRTSTSGTMATAWRSLSRCTTSSRSGWCP